MNDLTSRRLSRARLLLCIGLLSPHLALAGGAVFSSDGRWIFHLSSEHETAIAHYDLEAKPSARPASEETVFPEPLTGIARLSSGRLVVSSEGSVWKWNPEKKEKGIEAWLKIGQGQKIRWLAANPKDGSLLIGAWPRDDGATAFLWHVRRNESVLRKVFSRRVKEITGLCFNARAELIFSSNGDLWQGTLESDGDRDILIGSRWLAVAEHETYGGTSMGRGAHDVECSGGRVFFNHSRMGGSGWGQLVSVPEPPPFKNGLDLPALLNEAGRAAKDFWEIDDTGGSGVQLATSSDGRETFFRTHQGKHFLACERPEPKRK